MKKVIDTLNIELAHLKDREKDCGSVIEQYKTELVLKEQQWAECLAHIAQLEEALKRLQ